jgi:hypothetical protein
MRVRPLLVTFAFVLCAATAHAQSPGPSETDADAVVQARALYGQGIDLAKKSQWAEALGMFERSLALRAHPITLYNIGVCEWSLGRYTRARAVLGRSVEPSTAPSGELPASMAEEARGYLAQIERLLVHMQVDLRPADAGIAVDGRPLSSVDGVLVADLSAPGLGLPPPSSSFELVMDPGTRVITLSRKGFADVVLHRAFAPGSRGSLPLELSRLPATLHVDSSQPRSVVSVDGFDVGLAPVDLSRPAGMYRVVVRREGFDAFETKVELNAGEQANLQASLVPTKTPVTRTWWFWTSAATVLAGGVLLTYAITRPEPQPPPYERGSTGWLVEPAASR